jgi:hypothetical protein
MPPAFEPHVPPVIVGERGVAPAVVPPGEDAFTALTGGALQVHLASIVQFSRTSREKREIGSGQLWGRITGFPSGHDTVSWAAGRFEEAGIDDVRRQPFDQEPGAEFWLPLSWEMRLLGDPAFGAGTEDLVLTTAMPLAPSAVPPEGLEAPLVHAGFGTVAELTQIDVRGKVAVLTSPRRDIWCSSAARRCPGPARSSSVGRWVSSTSSICRATSGRATSAIAAAPASTWVAAPADSWRR